MRAKILNASAGSGKTYQLAYKYVRDVVEQPSIYRHILAVTFTNKATEEMKSRILKEIHLLASGGESSYLENLCRELDMDAATVRRRAAEVRSKILHDYSRFTVLTIDTFFQRILRAFIKALGIDLNYNVEIETASVLTKSADTLIEQITTDRDLQRWLTDFVQERIDEGKKWDVRDGILTLGGELFKEKNKEALSFARSREELGRIVGEATARAAATKQQMRERAAEAVRIMADAGVGPADFTGYQKVANPQMRAKFEAACGVELNRAAGLKATECFPAMSDGRIRGLFLFGEDPVRTDPDTGHVIRALESLDFFVCEELFMTETAKYADVILPGRSYAEKEGTFTNTERRVQRVRKAVDGPAGARLDTEVFADIMRRMGYDQPTLTGAQLMDEVASLTPSYAGISHARLDSAAVAGQGLQWPCTGPDHPGTRIMHEGAFSRGLGGYSLAQYRPSAEQPDEEFPLVMMTGRVLAQYNAQAMTGRTEGLNQIDGTSFIEINDADAAVAGIADGDRVRVSSRRGVIESQARVSGKTNPGEVWMPFHFQDGNANWLTNAALDNISATPEYKVCAVRVEKA